MDVKYIGNDDCRRNEGGFGTRIFEVQRSPNSEKHIVRISTTLDETPQGERCDCPGYRYRRRCSHIDAALKFWYSAVDADDDNDDN
jgi:hypothetical protein